MVALLWERTMTTLFRAAKDFVKQLSGSSRIYGMQGNSRSNQ